MIAIQDLAVKLEAAQKSADAYQADIRTLTESMRVGVQKLSALQDKLTETQQQIAALRGQMRTALEE